ncbi:MAG: hypothetical protein IJG45_07335 [Oscillospiraceae bacterium]|nr:hypothetical protein [Oscillospiraceae bacterium]
MEKINPKKARAVWQRVLQAKHEQPPMPRPERPPLPEQPSEAELLQWLAEIAALARGYRSMNAGRRTPQLRAMAAEEQGHYRQLAALFFLLYGRRPQVLSGAAPGRRSLAAGLRDAYAAEQNAVRQWREAATRYPAQRELFEDFIRDDRRHAEQLRRMMANL